jgi:membrane-bound lytic murein transglycosylase B
MQRTTRINALDNSEKDIRSLHERVLLVLGKSDFTDEEYEDALLAVQEAGWPVRAMAEDSLTPSQEQRLNADILDTLARQQLRTQNIAPGHATYEQYRDALDEAQQIIDQKAGI